MKSNKKTERVAYLVIVRIKNVERSDLEALERIQLSNWQAGTFWVDLYHTRLEKAFNIEPKGASLAETE